MKDNNDNKLSVFQFEGARYKTQLTKKFAQREAWKPDDPRYPAGKSPGPPAGGAGIVHRV